MSVGDGAGGGLGGEYAQVPRTGITAMRYAGFWIRFTAAVIDLLILGIAESVFVAFYSVAAHIPVENLDLKPGMTPEEMVAKMGPYFLAAATAFFVTISWVYFSALESSPMRASLGKKIIGLHVAGLEGERITFQRATTRFVTGRLLIQVPALGGIYCIAEFLCIAMTPRKQALHDMAARTVVLKNENM
jgi:uncharacterized RDD family membrane protein YckC